MTQLRLSLLLLRPSLLSLMVSGALAALFLVAVNWAFVVHSSALYTYFFGEYGLVTVLQQSPAGFGGMFGEVLTHPTARDALSYAFIFALGVVVYAVLSGLNALFAGALGTWAEWRALPGMRHQIHVAATERLFFRFTMLVLWAVYGWVFLRLLLPFSVSAARFGIATISDWPGPAYVGAGFMALVLSLHLHVIFARLMALRPRLFFSADAALENEAGRRR